MCTVLYSSLFLCWVGNGINGLCSYSFNEERFTLFTVCLVWFNIVDSFGITTFCLVCLSGPTAFLKVVPLLAAVALLTKCRTLISFGWVVTTTIVAVLYGRRCSAVWFAFRFGMSILSSKHLVHSIDRSSCCLECCKVFSVLFSLFIDLAC